MSDFENTLRSASLAILKRELTDNERIEFLELAGAIGMSSVEDYLYMLMIFKRNEDRITGQMIAFKKEMKARFDEMGVLEKKIDATLGKTLEDMLGKGAEKIGFAMGRDIVDAAQKILKTNGNFHFVRGQAMVACVMVLMVTVAYWLGNVNFFYFEGGMNYFRVLLMYPAGGLALLCGMIYTTAWYFDHDWKISAYTTYTVKFVLQIIVLLALLLRIIM